jgi:hypothetical protein
MPYLKKTDFDGEYCPDNSGKTTLIIRVVSSDNHPKKRIAYASV